jgi:hypothetical protein
MKNFTVSDKFEGGNILVEKIEGNDVYLKPDYRDSDPWFYWAFKIEGAQGQKLNFFVERPIVGRFGHQATVGYFGSAVSHDLKTWKWLYPENPVTEMDELYHFTYQFGEDETCVYFGHHYLYNLVNFDFDQKDGVDRKELCKDLDGTSCPYITFGKGDKVILLTARHHACESSASYILHGVIKELLENPIDGYKVICVPFVDVRGVVKGDQGKGRKPHDHNRDYSDTEKPIYPTVEAIKQIVKENHIRYSFDFHDPMSAGSDKICIVNHGGHWEQEDERLSELYANLSAEYDGAFKHINGSITRIGITPGMFSTYVGADERVRYGTTIEAPYYGCPENMMTEESYKKSGRAFANAIKQLIKEIDK